MTNSFSGARWVALAATIACGIVIGVVPASAGNGNVLYLLQDSAGAIGDGNSFGSNQALSNNSSIGSLGKPATQRGEGNAANIWIDSNCLALSNSCGHADLTQNNYAGVVADLTQTVAPFLPGLASALAGAVAGNTASLRVTNSGSAEVTQKGFGNVATLSTDGAIGTINQVGIGNVGTLSLTTALPLNGSGGLASGTLTQIGISNAASFNVTAAAGTTVSYTQIGAGLTQGPVTVSTNKDVSITQLW